MHKVILSFLFYFLFQISYSQTKEYSTDFFLKQIEKCIKKEERDSVNFYYKLLTEQTLKTRTYASFFKATEEVSFFFDGLGNFEKSIQVNQKALVVAEQLRDSLYQAQILIDLSHTYRIFHDYQKAIDYGKKAYVIVPKNESKQHILLNAESLNVTAAAFTENKQPDSALVYQKKVLQFIPKLDSTSIKNTFVNIGYTYMELNKLEEAKKYTDIGLKLYKPLKNNYALGAIYTNLGMYGRRVKKYDYALQMFDSAIYYSNKSKFIETFFWIYEEIAMVYESLNNYKKANHDLEKLLKIKDSIFQNERAKTAQEIEIKYETSKKEAAIAQQKEQLLNQQLELKNKTLYSLLLASALLFALIVFFAIYKRNQLKREQLEKEISLKDALATIKTQNRLQEQRLRISRDLHDNIGAQLTFIISSLDNLKFVTKDLDKVLKEKLNGISSFTSETIQQLRDTIWAMNKTEITAQDLHSRILSFIEKAKNTGITTSFEIKNNLENTITFSSLEGMNIFRIVQEAINNTIKYAEAKHVSVYLIQKDKQIYVRIKDDGKGFEVSKTQLGNGLNNMEKRASEINAKVHINSKIDKGTSIKIIL